MKICLLTQTLDPRTGAGVFAGNLIEGIKKQDPDNDISAMTGEDLLKPSLWKILKNLPSIRREIKKADIVHAMDAYPYGVISCIANIAISKPIIITAIGSGSIRNINGYGFKSVSLRWAYGKATFITSISHYVASEIKKILPLLHIEVINPGVDYNFYSDNREEVGSPASYEFVITQGEFKKRKGYEEILPVMKEVMKTKPDLRYVIVANDSRNKPYQGILYRLMDDLGIQDKVIVRSSLKREELRKAYGDALLYLSLPKNVNGDIEGFGMAIMEAAATGTPSVVGRGSGADDAVSDGQSGFLVDGGNKEEVVRKVLSVIEDGGLRERLSLGAKKWASKNIWESKISKYIELYKKLQN